jgi:hypothetical protein
MQIIVEDVELSAEMWRHVVCSTLSNQFPSVYQIRNSFSSVICDPILFILDGVGIIVQQQDICLQETPLVKQI